MVCSAKIFQDLSSSNTLSAQTHTPFLLHSDEKTHPFSCVFGEKGTLDVGTPAVPYIYTCREYPLPPGYHYRDEN